MIYLDMDNGTWGDSELLILVDDKEWTNEDFEEMHNWSDSMIIEYGRMWDSFNENPEFGNLYFVSTWQPPTPKQWAEQDYLNPFDKTE